ncbi:MAG: O-antigen ligase family protein [Chloroflexi bacterium]|nr:O-antigen ligase family protein [Chloroflexota bacterium]
MKIYVTYVSRLLPSRDRCVALVCLLILALSPFFLRPILAELSLQDRGVAWGQAQAEAFAADDFLLGINAALEDEHGDRLARGIGAIKDGGYGWVRQEFPWREIEPTKGNYDWGKWDKLVATYSSAGLRVIARLDQPPRWARQDNNWVNRPPDSFADYADFVGAFVKHYEGVIGYVQIWDEPNVFPNWGNRAVDPAGYVELLKGAYQSAKVANPEVEVLTAGLAPNLEKGGRNMADTLFLEEMYRYGARSYFDILAAKPYGLWNPPEDRRVGDDVLNFSRVVRLREIMVGYGDGRKPVWAVEFGWNSLPEDWKGDPSVWGGVTERAQAAYTEAAIERARREWPWLRVMLLQGFGPQYAPANPVYGFSVVDQAFRPRPVYEAAKRAAAGSIAPPGRHSTDSKYIQYQGTWQRLEHGVVGKAGDSLRLPFYGTRIDAVIWQSQAGGTIQVAVDGRTENLSPQLSSAARVSLFSPISRRAKLELATGLEDREHLLELTIVQPAGSGASPSLIRDGGEGRTGGEARIEGFVVARDAPFSAYQVLIAALVALQAGAFLWLFVLLGRFYRATWPPFRARVQRWLKAMLSWALSAAKRLDQAASGGRCEWLVLAMSLSLAIFYFISFVPVAIASLLAYALLAWLRPDIGLLFVIFAAPFYLLTKRFGSLQFSMVETLVVVCGVVLVLRHAASALDGERQRGWPKGWESAALERIAAGARVNLPIVLLVVASVLSLLAAERVQEGLREFRVVIVEPVIYYWLLTRTLSKEKVLWLVQVLLISAAVISGVALYQYFLTGDVITAEGVLRAKAFYGSPNNLGLFLGRALPLAVCLGWFGERRAKLRALYLAVALLLAVTLTLTFSAGAWLGVGVGLLLVIGFRSVRLGGLAATGAIGLAILLPQVLRQERIVSRFDLEQGTAALRLMIWQAAARMIQDHPLLGVGPDNFLNQYPRYMLAAAWREPNLSHPHNLVLDFWLRTGLLGLLAGLWLIGRFFAAGVRLYRRQTDLLVKALALGLLGSMTDFVVHGMIDNSYFTVDLAIIFWASMAAVQILEGDKRLT